MTELDGASPQPALLAAPADATGTSRIRVTGPWRLAALAGRTAALLAQLRAVKGSQAWDLRDITALDSAGAMLLWEGWGGRLPDHLEARPEHRQLFTRIEETQAVPLAPPPRFDLLRPLLRLGAQTLTIGHHLRDMTILLGQFILSLLYLLRHPRQTPLKETSATIYHAGATALSITGLVGFLIGVVVSYLSALQLQPLGADIFLVNILSIGVVRELGPLITAILVAGRSGSAMTAQLGVMHVTQELDAMVVMGLSPVLRLMVPKVIALALAMPLLTIWTDTIALWGGVLAAKWQLHVSVRSFVHSIPAAMPIANLWLGLGKAVVFGVVTAIIACYYGFQIKPDTQSLGAGTTRSVVTAISTVIIIDAVFAIVFAHVGM